MILAESGFQVERLRVLEMQMKEMKHSLRFVLTCIYKWNSAQLTIYISHGNTTPATNPPLPSNFDAPSVTNDAVQTPEFTRTMTRLVVFSSAATTVSLTHSSLPSWDVVTVLVDHFLHYCNYQPLPLFSPPYLLATLRSRDDELLLAILALSVRFSYATDTDIGTTGSIYASSSRTLVMRRLSEGPVELSTIQTLCILSILEFNSKTSSYRIV